MMTAVLLAAGESRRMGAENKLLLPYKGSVILDVVVRELLASNVDEIVVVTGYESERVAKLLDRYSVRLIHNETFKLGMTSSIQCGVREASKSSVGYMICLGDLPGIPAAIYSAIADRFAEQQSDTAIALPTVDEKRGHPVVLGAAYRDDILKHKEPNGCNEIIRKNKQRIIYCEVPCEHILLDIDTPEEYAAVAKNNKTSQ